MALIQSLITQNRYSIKCPYQMTPKGVCIHNTANDASAANEIAYMKNNNNEVSFHVAIDDKEAIQGIPLTRNAWAAGDGLNGAGNRSYIHIEICYSKSGGTRFTNAEKRTAKEVAALLKKYNWTLANVKKHQDFMNKKCPHRTLDLGWNRFLNMIQAELNLLNPPAPVAKSTTIKVEIVGSEKIISQYKENGIFTCSVDRIYFRDKVGISSSNAISGNYSKNESIRYDYVVITNKYVYISWISSSTKKRRFMPITDRSTDEKWGSCK